MIQLRLGQASLAAEMASVKRDQAADREITKANHKQNRDSIHTIIEGMETMQLQVSEVASKIDDYLLVQATIAQQLAKAWWKQPLGTAVIVAVITIVWASIEHGMGWLR